MTNYQVYVCQFCTNRADFVEGETPTYKFINYDERKYAICPICYELIKSISNGDL